MDKLFKIANKFANLVSNGEEYFEVFVELESGNNHKFTKVFSSFKEAELFLHQYAQNKSWNIFSADIWEGNSNPNLFACYELIYRNVDDGNEPYDTVMGYVSVYNNKLNIDNKINKLSQFSQMLLKFLLYSKRDIFAPYYTQNPKELLTILRGMNHKFVTKAGYHYDDREDDEGFAYYLYIFFKYIFSKHYPEQNFPNNEDILVSLDELEENGFIDSNREYSDFWKEFH